MCSGTWWPHWLRWACGECASQVRLDLDMQSFVRQVWCYAPKQTERVFKVTALDSGGAMVEIRVPGSFEVPREDWDCPHQVIMCSRCKDELPEDAA